MCVCVCVVKHMTELLFVAGLVKALKAVNQTTWNDAFLGLWIAALRLVQRVGSWFFLYSLEYKARLEEIFLCVCFTRTI